MANKDTPHQVVVNLFEEAKKNHPHMRLSIDAEQLVDLFYQLSIGDLRTHALFLLMLEGKPVGFLAGMCVSTSPIAFGVYVASELGWYVQPEHRGQGKELLKCYEQWARVVGAQYITCAHMNDDVAPVLDKMYTRMGYKIAEVTYLKEA